MRPDGAPAIGRRVPRSGLRTTCRPAAGRPRPLEGHSSPLPTSDRTGGGRARPSLDRTAWEGCARPGTLTHAREGRGLLKHRHGATDLEGMPHRPSRLHVVIVDDEELALSGMRRRLNPYRDRWRMQLFQRGDDALDHIRRHGADVILCDLHLGDDNGTRVLEEVRKLSPRTLRLLISASTDTDLILSSIGPSHGFLAKPCIGDEIERCILRTERMRQHFTDAEIVDALGGILKGPLFPSTWVELVDPLQSRHRGLELGDCAMLAAKLFEQLRVGAAANVDLNGAWRRGLAAARLADRICRVEGIRGATRTEAMAAALLACLGQLLLIRYGASATSIAKDREALGADAEKGPPRGDSLAGYALALWGFPPDLIDAVVFHARPRDAEHTEGSPLLPIVHVACALGRATSESPGDAREKALDREYLETAGFGESIDAWVEADTAAD